MSVLVTDCPRCNAKSMTFDVTQELRIGIQYGWQLWYEAFCICRNCKRSTTFVLSQNNDSDKDVVHAKGLLKIEGSLNEYMNIERYVGLRDIAAQAPPKHLPPDIDASFIEAGMCLSIGCWNAAGVMFRMCVDRASQQMLPEDETPGLSTKTRRDLGLRLPWLFDNGYLPEGLRELSTCIREDGNDGAHAGTLTKEDTEDLLDFTTALLERLYTEPERLRLAKERRQARRA